MSNQQKNSQNRIPARQRRAKLVARILAAILAFLMIGGSAYYLVYLLITPASATNDASFSPSYSGTLLEDLNVRVGLMYADGVTSSFKTVAPAGYTVGIQPLSDGVFDFVPIMDIDATSVAVAADGNLSSGNSGYSVVSSPANAAVGGYHVEFVTDYSIADVSLLAQQISLLNAALYNNGIYAFPAYCNGVLRIRVGAFTTRAEAEAMYPVISAQLPLFASYVTDPSSTIVVAVDTSSDRILFSYDTADGTTLGLKAVQTSSKKNYIKSPANNVYDGVFSYKHHISATADGIAVTNVLTLDQYVQGVLPYEISASWPIETQSAFAIAARSYAASCLGRHQSTHGFDLCNAAHCQAYHGAGRVTDKVIEATTRTHGLIIVYDGAIASTYYSSSCGGYTVSLNEVWGGASRDYLVAHATPWERYSEHNNGFWTVEVSPSELLRYLVDTKGYSELAGGSYITSVEPIGYATNSTYVKKLRITANNGASITINATDNVRMALSAYLKSANFVVGQGSVEYTLDTVEIVGERVIDNAVQKHVLPPVTGEVTEITSEGFISTFENIALLTAEANIFTSLAGLSVLTAAGETVIDADTALVLTADNAAAFGEGSIQKPSDDPNAGQIAYPQTVKEYAVRTETKTATASSPENFIFVGKGWGHGAGMSQYGANDLGELGYDYEQIINAYFTDVTIVYYKELEIFKNR